MRSEVRTGSGSDWVICRNRLHKRAAGSKKVMKAKLLKDLPTSRTCNRCDIDKPREEMIVQHRNDKGGYFYMRPICKDCYNAKERGHRREYKRKYLENWRKKNRALDKSYRQTDHYREKAAKRSYTYFKANHAAILIKKRLAFRDIHVTLDEAKEMLEQFGPCYPTPQGLTKKGLRECERIRSRLRVRNVDRRRRQTAVEIRMMVYEEAGDFVIPPDQQEMPYRSRSERMKQRHRNKRIMEATA